MNVIPKHLDATISKLVDIGCEVEEFDDAVRVVAKKRLRCTQVKTLSCYGISDGYAASDRGGARFGKRNEYDHGKYF